MRSRRLATSFGFALGLLLFGVAPAQGQEEFRNEGTWKLNVAKSTFGPGMTPRSVVSTVRLEGESVRMSGVRIDADGIRTEAKFTAKLDGKDYPIQGTNHAHTVSLKRVDSRTVERTDKRDGKVIETSKTVYSDDGKTSTTTGKGRCSKGEEFDYIIVNEKQ